MVGLFDLETAEGGVRVTNSTANKLGRSSRPEASARRSWSSGRRLGPASLPALSQHATLEEAMRAYVQARGERFAGACEQTTPDQHIGMWCSEVDTRTDDRAVVDFGPTFSQFVVRVTFERTNGEWQVVAEEPLTSSSPATRSSASPSASVRR
jgi:hypothetical protein